MSQKEISRKISESNTTNQTRQLPQNEVCSRALFSLAKERV